MRDVPVTKSTGAIFSHRVDGHICPGSGKQGEAWLNESQKLTLIERYFWFKLQENPKHKTARWVLDVIRGASIDLPARKDSS